MIRAPQCCGARTRADDGNRTRVASLEGRRDFRADYGFRPVVHSADLPILTVAYTWFQAMSARECTRRLLKESFPVARRSKTASPALEVGEGPQGRPAGRPRPAGSAARSPRTASPRGRGRPAREVEDGQPSRSRTASPRGRRRSAARPSRSATARRVGRQESQDGQPSRSATARRVGRQESQDGPQGRRRSARPRDPARIGRP